MSIWKTAIFIAVFVLLGLGLYNLRQEKIELESEMANLKAEIAGLQNENKTLQERLNYFRVPENLLKELKSQFNYREEGEEMMIIVPKR